MNDADLSVLEDFGRNSSHCGYCKRDGASSISHGMWAHTLPAAAYQASGTAEDDVQNGCKAIYLSTLYMEHRSSVKSEASKIFPAA